MGKWVPEFVPTWTLIPTKYVSVQALMNCCSLLCIQKSAHHPGQKDKPKPSSANALVNFSGVPLPPGGKMKNCPSNVQSHEVLCNVRLTKCLLLCLSQTRIDAPKWLTRLTPDFSNLESRKTADYIWNYRAWATPKEKHYFDFKLSLRS